MGSLKTVTMLRRQFLLASLALIFADNVFAKGSEVNYIPLADHLEPRSTEGQRAVRQAYLLQNWTGEETSDETVAWGKEFKLGSQESVYAEDDKGFLSTVMAAYNNHWVLRTRPEDWWATVSQIIATRIDRHAEDPAIREFFVSHEGKKSLTVEIGPSLQGINNEKFFQEMISQITENINKPQYTKLMKSDFSQSTSEDKIVNSIMLMYSFQEYFEYRALLACGIPGVIMDGSEQDWQKLVNKLEYLETFLQDLDSVLDLAEWFRTAKVVLTNLLNTYQGNPDRDWWSKIFDKTRSYGSGGGKTLSGWFVTDFMGIHGGKLSNVPSGLNVVPLTLTDGDKEEEAALVGGVTGYNISQSAVTDRATNKTYPSVQTVHGWALLVDPSSSFD